MNAEDQKILKEIKARLPTIETIDEEGESLGVADDLAELLALIENYKWSTNARE
jgi:hypothetical protein